MGECKIFVQKIYKNPLFPSVNIDWSLILRETKQNKTKQTKKQTTKNKNKQTKTKKKKKKTSVAL